VVSGWLTIGIAFVEVPGTMYDRVGWDIAIIIARQSLVVT